MEKSSSKYKRNKFCRLLVFLFFSVCGAFSREPTNAEIRSLTVKPDTENFFTAQENGYTLIIPGIEPARVQTDLPSLPPGVQFVSSKKDEYLSPEGERGTAVHLWFTFTDTGLVKMPPLIVQIGRRTFYLRFEKTIVYENPSVISPVMEIEFKQGVQEKKTNSQVKKYTAIVGEEIQFYLNLKYFVQIIQFSWELPENSIFKELERFEIERKDNSANTFSPKASTIAKFSWKPLVPGVYTLPNINISAISYNGSRKIVPMPACEISVVDNKSANSDSSRNVVKSVYEKAFNELELAPIEFESFDVTGDDCAKLANIRSVERHSFPWGSIKNERKNFELSLGISNSAEEDSEPIFVVLVICFVLAVGFSILFILLKISKLSITCVYCSFVFLVFSIWNMVGLVPKYGIFAGGIISPVPEFNSDLKNELPAGIRIRIVEKAGDWALINYSDVTGWINTDLIYEIK